MTTSELAVGTEPSHFKSNPGDIEIPNRVFVKGFSRETSEEDLKVFFEEFGIVRESKIVKDKSGVSKGYAFITFDSQDVAETVKALEAVEYSNKELVLGPARIRKKRPTFRGRPDQVWGTSYNAHCGVGGIQQPVYATTDGLWYFQSAAPQIVSVVPNHLQVSGQNYWPTQYSSQVQLQAPPPSMYPISTGNISQPVSTSYQVGNVNWNDLIRLTRKTATSILPVSPPESPDFATGGSPVQCVPVYESGFIGEDGSLAATQEAQNVVLIDTGDRKFKKVIMRRDGAKHVLPSQYTASGIPNVSVHAAVGPGGPE